MKIQEFAKWNISKHNVAEYQKNCDEVWTILMANLSKFWEVWLILHPYCVIWTCIMYYIFKLLRRVGLFFVLSVRQSVDQPICSHISFLSISTINLSQRLVMLTILHPTVFRSRPQKSCLKSIGKDKSWLLCFRMYPRYH